ncbi:glycoside hydrolase family 27 protein [Plebeiibacterium marinum]|uniref:Alpha-galactosidase n=1 Tax=Plebeiibacterium marinum TaxID=2992111 RepID=A0AAE3MCX7_9BACT|nr:glycoside hydrolase family 27 protein [Plebeiobacterium marinum]MCW3805354.1 glycoside hydrolase family 27 protein [Plebeiobacterium marinum]
MKRLLILSLMVFAISLVNGQKSENLALTPPMGWNSWNTFGCDINEELIKGIADAMVERGLRDAGYEYLVLDDGWMAMERDENGRLYGDTIKFPNGMKALGDYIHSKGLKFGIYNCAGFKTCAGYPGSRGYEYIDAQTYADWGVDFLKYDWCNTEKLNAEGAYLTMRDALYATGRPIVFSICEWGDSNPWKWGKEIGHLWRVSGDIINCWNCEVGHGSWSSWGIWKIINMRTDIRKYAGPGHWNDLDMMEVGNDLTDAENRSHFAMWSILASPLIMGNDIRSATPKTIETLSNEGVVAVNQDSLGIQGFRFSDEYGIETWIKPLINGDWAIVFVNMNDKEVKLYFDWLKHDIGDDVSQKFAKLKYNTYQIQDLFNNKDLGDTSTPLNARIGQHDVLMIRLNKQ